MEQNPEFLEGVGPTRRHAWWGAGTDEAGYRVMHIFLINLDRCIDRKHRIALLLEKTGLLLHHVRAIDGDRLVERPWPAPSKPGALPAERTILSRFEIAVVLSHRRAWRQFLRTRETHCVVLEDDVYFGARFAEFLEGYELKGYPFDIVKLETLGAPVITGRCDRHLQNGRRVDRLLSTHMGAAGYVITRDAAKRLLALSAGAPLGVDSILFDFDRMQKSGLKPFRIGQVIPAPVIQYDTRRDAPSEDALLTSVVGARRGYRLSHTGLSGEKILRETIRPFRQFWRGMRYRTIEFQ